MSALLRYAFLKSWRDRSILVFTIPALVFPLAALVGATLSRGLQNFHYPFAMDPGMSAVRSATLAATISTMICCVFASMPAFWLLRSEISTRSIISIAVASRPLLIALMAVLFSAIIGIATWITMIGIVCLLTAGIPAQLTVLAIKIVIGALTAGAVGTLATSISPEPAMIVAAYMPVLIIMVWFEKAKGPAMVLLPLTGAVICTAVAGFLLERRCAR